MAPISFIIKSIVESAIIKINLLRYSADPFEVISFFHGKTKKKLK